VLAGAAQAQLGGADAQLVQLADTFLDSWYLPNHPTEATLAGVHDYDGRLEVLERRALNAQIAALHGFERRFAALSAAALSEHYAADRELLLGRVRSDLLDLERIRRWQKDPDLYTSVLSNGAFTIMARRFAPDEERLRRLIEREQRMPAVLAAARANLRNPPRIFTAIALEQLPDTIRFFQNDVPAAFAAVTDPRLRLDFAASNAAVIAALERYRDFVRTGLMPHSHGEFRLGAALFRRKLELDEMVTTPLPQLLAIGLADLQHNQHEFALIAAQLEPTLGTREVLGRLNADHPTAADLLASVQADFTAVRQFLRRRQLITLPDAPLPSVEETPPFMRATTFASMDTPGPFEAVATEAYFNVTVPDATLTPKALDEALAQWSYPLISNTVVHEAYPGHYVQFLWMHRIDDRVRKLFGASSNAEGWAHYCEQMMLDEGFGQPGDGARDARAALWLRLGQLHQALLRDARFVVAIRLHTGSMSFDQAVDYFVREGYQERAAGLVEVKRAAGDPIYLYYTLGKLQILKLRADVKRRQGAAFDLRVFHDAFMREGFPPIRIVRRSLLHDDSPTL